MASRAFVSPPTRLLSESSSSLTRPLLLVLTPCQLEMRIGYRWRGASYFSFSSFRRCLFRKSPATRPGRFFCPGCRRPALPPRSSRPLPQSPNSRSLLTVASDSCIFSTRAVPPLNMVLSWRYKRQSLRFPISVGIVPLKSLLLRYKYKRLLRSPSLGGIAPVKSLLWRRSSSRLLRSPSLGGIVPVKSLFWSCRNCRVPRSVSSDGIVPVNSFPLRYSRCTLPRSPSLDGIVPVNLIVVKVQSLHAAQVSQLRRYRPG